MGGPYIEHCMTHSSNITLDIVTQFSDHFTIKAAFDFLLFEYLVQFDACYVLICKNSLTVEIFICKIVWKSEQVAVVNIIYVWRFSKTA